jgi:hypothetical protein
MELSYAGDVEFGHDAALPSFDELHLRWFDRWLRIVARSGERLAIDRSCGCCAVHVNSAGRPGAGHAVEGCPMPESRGDDPL